MASLNLYPPIISNYLPAFVGNDLVIRFQLPKMIGSNVSSIKGIQVTICDQKTNENVLQNGYAGTGSLSGVYCYNGIYIQNISFNSDIEQSITINKTSIKNSWEIGKVYKIQIRLSEIEFEDSGTTDIEKVQHAAEWFKNNANQFSEWSTVCLTKYTDKPLIQFPILNYSEIKKNSNEIILSQKNLESLNLVGTYSNTDISEPLNLYNIKLKIGDTIVEESKVLYTNSNKIEYLFKTQLDTDVYYTIEFYYETINKYSETREIKFYNSYSLIDNNLISIHTLEDIDMIENKEIASSFIQSTSKMKEEDEGRIYLKLYNKNEDEYFNGTIIIRRTDEKSNFKVWEELKVIKFENQLINEYPAFYDYLIESDIHYKYGVQIVLPSTVSSIRSKIISQDVTTIRSFEYSYLLGENNQQLKLNLNNTLNSYAYTILEQKTDPLGGKYPIFSRNGDLKYRTFPLSGLISYVMDNENTFDTNKKDYSDFYDYRNEFDFREKVLNFLQDGKAKLFKSPTEGNIIIRLTGVTATPEKSLNRLLYSFSATATEIADNTFENYSHYNILNLDEITSDNYEFIIEGYKQEKYKMILNETNLITAIQRTLVPDVEIESLGYIDELKEIYNLNINFEGEKLEIKDLIGGNHLGHNLLYNNSIITILTDNYNFDELIKLTPEDEILIGEGKIGGKPVNEIEVTVTFNYTLIRKPYVPKIIEEQYLLTDIGQYYNFIAPGQSIYNEIVGSYLYNWDDYFCKPARLNFSELYAEKGSQFQINYSLNDFINITIDETECFDLTGFTDINDIIYLGSSNQKVLLNYTKSLYGGKYKTE